MRPCNRFHDVPVYLRVDTSLARRHRSDFLPVLQNSVASRRRRELCRPRPTGRAPAGALMRRVDDFIDAARQLTGIRTAFGNGVHLLRARLRIDGEMARRMCSDAARFRKSEYLMIGDENGISRHVCRHGFSVYDAARQLPRPSQQSVIPLNSGRLCCCLAWSAGCATGRNE